MFAKSFLRCVWPSYDCSQKHGAVPVCLCACVRARVPVCLCACVPACVPACLCACASARTLAVTHVCLSLCLCVFVSLCLCACVFVGWLVLLHNMQGHCSGAKTLSVLHRTTHETIGQAKLHKLCCSLADKVRSSKRHWEQDKGGR